MRQKLPQPGPRQVMEVTIMEIEDVITVEIIAAETRVVIQVLKFELSILNLLHNQ